MPESGAVYQPTTVGYSYDTRDGGGYRGNLARMMSRYKMSTRRWTEWFLITVAAAMFLTGLITVLMNVIRPDNKTADPQKTSDSEVATPEMHEHSGDGSQTSLAVGASLILIGLVLGSLWAWLRFFKPNKSARGVMTSNSAQMLGGLNPSTDLLVGSTSQYGPVLTELPSQMKSKECTETVRIPLSDQEEEMHTLMPESATSASATGNTEVSQIPG